MKHNLQRKSFMLTSPHKKLFSEVNAYFNHTYVLTILRATERHKAISTELAGLNFSFFYGYDKQELSIEMLEKEGIYNMQKAVKNNRYGKPMKLGEIACSMGHKAIYEDMLAKGYSNALILEDDVIVNTSAAFDFAKIMQQLPDNWDVVYFDYLKNDKTNLFTRFKQLVYHLQKMAGKLKFTHIAINNLYAKPFSSNLKIAGYHDYASAYAISNKAAKLLVQLQTPIAYPADHVLPYAITNKLLNGFITVPKIFCQLSQTNKNTVGSYVEN